MNAAARVVCAVAMVALAGCVEEHTVRPDYAAYLAAQQYALAAQAEQRAALERDLTAQANRCTTDACSIAVAGFRALALSGGSAATTVAIAQPQPERNGWDRALALMGVISPILGYAVQWRSIEESNQTQRYTTQQNANVQIAQANAWTGLVKEVAAVPSFYVGGDYQSVGGDLTGRDKTGRDRIDNSGLYNTGSSNRFASPDIGGAVSGCQGGNSGPGGPGAPGGAGGVPGAAGGTGGNGAAGGAGAASGAAGDAGGCVGGSAGG